MLVLKLLYERRIFLFHLYRKQALVLFQLFVFRVEMVNLYEN